MRWRRDDGTQGMPGSSTRWVVVATCASGLEADVLVAVLGAARIPARAKGNDIVGLFGPNFAGATARGVDVLVPEDAEEEAREVLAEADERADAADDAESGASER
jgi:hypothetical protein